jgi:hypothetical protein
MVAINAIINDKGKTVSPYRRIRLRFSPLYAAAYIFLLCGACDDAALEPREFGWVKMAEFAGFRIKGLSERDGILRAVGENQTGAVILMREGSTFRAEYTSPSGYEDVQLVTVVAGARSGWAGGCRTVNAVRRPFLLRYSGKWPSGQWEELDTAAFPAGSITAVHTINEHSCWLLIEPPSGSREFPYRGRKGFGLLAKYSAGRLDTYDEFGPVTATCTNYEGRPNILYAVPWPSKEYGPHYDDVKVFATADNGATWADATVPRDVVKGRRVARAMSGGYDVGHFYLIADFGEDGPTGILRKEAGTEDGPFELIFLSYEGPYFHDLIDVVFRKPQQGPYGFSVDGVAVGEVTSVIFDDGDVFLEKLPYPLTFASPVPRDRTSGFWAIGKNLVLGPDELLYHP